MSFSIYDIDEIGSRTIDGHVVKTFKKKFGKPFALEACAGSSKYDKTLGIKTFLKLSNACCTPLKLDVDGQTFNTASDVELTISGDAERIALIKALEFIVDVLKEADKYEVYK